MCMCIMQVIRGEVEEEELNPMVATVYLVVSALEVDLVDLEVDLEVNLGVVSVVEQRKFLLL